MIKLTENQVRVIKIILFQIHQKYENKNNKVIRTGINSYTVEYVKAVLEIILENGEYNDEQKKLLKGLRTHFLYQIKIYYNELQFSTPENMDEILNSTNRLMNDDLSIKK